MDALKSPGNAEQITRAFKFDARDIF